MIDALAGQSLLAPMALIQWDDRLLPWAVAAAGAAVLAISGAYLAKRRPSTESRRFPPQPIVRRLMPVLRGAAWITLIISLLKPSVLVSLDARDHGVVLVLIDRSKSMSVQDSYRSPSQWVALADALGRLPPGKRSNVADAFLASIDRIRARLDELALARREVDFNRFPGRDRDSAQAHLRSATSDLDASIHDLLKLCNDYPQPGQPLGEALSAIGNGPSQSGQEQWAARFRRLLDRVASTARELQNSDDTRLYHNDPEVHAVCDAMRPMNRIDLAGAAITAPTGVLKSVGAKTPIFAYGIGDSITSLSVPALQDEREFPSASGNRSELASGVRQAVDAFGRTHNRPIQAVLLLSDGRATSNDPPDATGLPGANIPLFTIAMAPAAVIHDAAITHVTAPDRAFLGDVVPIRVGLRGRIKEVRIHLANSAAAPQTRPGPSSDAETEMLFHLQLAEAGPQKIVAEIITAPGETALPENNIGSAWIKVTAKKVRVALVSGSAGRDVDELRSILAETPWIDLQADSSVSSSNGWSMSPHDILEQDVLIFNDLSADSLDGAQRDAVRRLVEMRGGGVLLLAGVAHPTHADADAWGDWFPLLPSPDGGITPAWRVWAGSRPAFQFVPATGAEDNKVLQLAGTPELSLARWGSLPPAMSYLPLRQPRSRARGLLMESESHDPVMIDRTAGAGDVMLLGTNELWRWSAAGYQQEEDRFWLQCVRALAGTPYAETSGPLSFEVNPSNPQPMQPIQVRARLQSEGHPPTLPLEILRNSELLRTETLSPQAIGERYECVIPGLPAGNYVFRLSTPAGTQPARLEYPINVTVDDHLELADISGDRDFLRRLAEPTGGEMIPIEDLPKLPAALQAGRQKRLQLTQIRLWDSDYLFWFVFACLVAEWALRKRFGLA